MPEPTPRDVLQAIDSLDAKSYAVATRAAGPQGSLPLTDEMLSALAQRRSVRPQRKTPAWVGARPKWPDRSSCCLSTQGGVRADDGTPVALGYHTGHWEVGLLVREAARVLKAAGAVPFAAYCSDPCDGRTQGTVGMFDSLPYRNDAAIVLRRLIRSLPTRRGVLGVATCDKGLPAMMLALAGVGELPCVLVPGGVTLPPAAGEDAGKIQSIGARYAHGEISLEDAAALGCRACASPGGGCQFLGTAATAQVVGEALGLALPHSALAPSGQPIWLDMARRSAHGADRRCDDRGIKLADILTDAAMRNAMVVHAAFGGSTNLLLHIPAIAHAAGLRVPTVDDWHAVNLLRAAVGRRAAQRPGRAPDGARVSGRRRAGSHAPPARVWACSISTCSPSAGCTLGETLDWWQQSMRRARLRELLRNARRRRAGRRDHVARTGRRARIDQHRLFSARQPGARGLGHQEHGHRSARGRRRRRVSQDRPGARLHARTRCRGGHQGTDTASRSAPAT